MPSTITITVPQLARLVGLPSAPTIIDVRTEVDLARDPRLLPCAIHRDLRDVQDWAPGLVPGPAVLVCQEGLKLSQGTAAWLRQLGVAAEHLEGGFEAWRNAGGVLVANGMIPERPARGGGTLWVTRTARRSTACHRISVIASVSFNLENSSNW